MGAPLSDGHHTIGREPERPRTRYQSALVPLWASAISRSALRGVSRYTRDGGRPVRLRAPPQRWRVFDPGEVAHATCNGNAHISVGSGDFIRHDPF